MENEQEVQEQSAPKAPLSRYDLIGQFNATFEGKAYAVIEDGRLLITIGHQTAVFAMPVFFGAQFTD